MDEYNHPPFLFSFQIYAIPAKTGINMLSETTRSDRKWDFAVK